jgi:hemin uptake protein HemP
MMSAAAEDNDPPPAGSTPRPAASVGRTISIVGGRIDSRDIFVGTREIIISHGRERYRLRLTAQNKLILTK